VLGNVGHARAYVLDDVTYTLLAMVKILDDPKTQRVAHGLEDFGFEL
jgi:hypothetical protein